MRCLLTVAICLGLGMPAHAEETFALPNGLRVVLAPNQRATRVALLVRYAVGSRDNPKGYRGLAHLTEHLTFAQLDALAELQKLGATAIQGTTSQDDTKYSAYLPRRSLESALWLEASRMAFHLDQLNERELKNTEQVVIAEWHERRHDSGLSLGDLEAMHALYPPTHPYYTRGDDPDDVRAIQLRDVHWFAQQHYRPDRATLVVTGGFEPVQVRGWVERYFGAVRAAGVAQPRSQARAPAPLSQSCKIDVPANLPDEALIATWLGPERGSEDELVLQVIERLLAAPLQRLTRDDPEVASAASHFLHLELAQEMRVMIHGRSPIHAARLVPKLDGVLTALRDGRLNAGLQAAIARSVEPRTRELIDEANELSHGPLQDDRERLQRVRGEDIVRVARKWLDPKRRVLLLYGSRSQRTGRVHVDCEPTP